MAGYDVIKRVLKTVFASAVITAVIFSSTACGMQNGSGDNAKTSSDTADKTSEEAKAAVKAYDNFLAQDSFNRGSEDKPQTWYLVNCSFNLAYIDDDDVPELLLCDYSDADHATGWGEIYTYADGEIKEYGRLSSPEGDSSEDDVGYYEHSGYYMVSSMYQGSGVISVNKENHDMESEFIKRFEVDENGLQTDISYSVDGKECSESDFNDEIKKRTAGADFIKYKYYENTVANREKILGVEETGEEGSEKSSPAASDEDVDDGISISSGDEAVGYIKDLTDFKGGNTGDFENVKIGYMDFSDGFYRVHLYNDMDDHISTLALYGVTEEGYVYDLMSEEWVINENGQVRNF